MWTLAMSAEVRRKKNVHPKHAMQMRQLLHRRDKFTYFLKMPLKSVVSIDMHNEITYILKA